MNNTLNQLLQLDSENEIVEFQEAKNTYDFNKLGKYFSELSNKENLKILRRPWLLFGVKANQTVIGCRFRSCVKERYSN